MSNDLTKHQSRPSAERVELFQSLEPGYYWRAKRDVQLKDPHWERHFYDVEAGTTLLLLDIEMFDRRPHTVVLHCHPRDGESSYKMLVEDFLDAFEPDMDGEKVREKEMAGVQFEIEQDRHALLHKQADPKALRAEIQEDLEEWEKAEGRKRGKADTKALAVVQPEGLGLNLNIGTALDARVEASTVEAMRRVVEREGKTAELIAERMQKDLDALQERVESLVPYIKERTKVALARVSGVQAYADALTDGLESLDLYVGKGLELHTLHKGKSAPSSEPLTLFQRKLFAEEEYAAHADVGKKFDFRDGENFEKELISNSAFLDQLIPAQRGVVSVTWRRSDLEYGDRWMNESYNKLNKTVFLLVRDGENLHMVYSSVESHEHAPRLFPQKAEFDRLFEDMAGRDITYRDIRFTERAKDADRLAVHYKRFLILLCGLDHRLKLFGEFYPSDHATGFLKPAFQQSYFRFVHDDEDGALLGDARKEVGDWMDGMNKYLQSGSRVYCYFEDLMTEYTAPACIKSRWGGKDYYQDKLATPTVDSAVHIARQDQGEVVVDVRVKRRSAEYKDLAQPEFDARVSLTVAEQKRDSSREPAGYLVLDAIEPEDLEYYIKNRAARIKHAEYLALFRRALAHINAERGAEAKARAWLLNSIAEAGIAQGKDAERLVSAAIRNFRAANRGAPLPTDRALLTPILDHLFVSHSDAGLLERVEAHIAKRHYIPLKVALRRGKAVLYVETPAAERDETFGAWRWVSRIPLETGKKVLMEGAARFHWLHEDRANEGEQVLKTWDAKLAEWTNTAPSLVHPRDFATARTAAAEGYEQLLALHGDGIPPSLFERWVSDYQEMQRQAKRRVLDVDVDFVLGAMLSRSGGRGHDGPNLAEPLRWRNIVVSAPVEEWVNGYGTPEQRQVFSGLLHRYYAKKDYAAKRAAAPFAPEFGLVEGLSSSGMVVRTRKDRSVAPLKIWESKQEKVFERDEEGDRKPKSVQSWSERSAYCTDTPLQYELRQGGVMDGGKAKKKLSLDELIAAFVSQEPYPDKLRFWLYPAILKDGAGDLMWVLKRAGAGSTSRPAKTLRGK